MTNQLVKLVHLFGFITKKFVTIHGHTNVRKSKVCHLAVYLRPELKASVKLVIIQSLYRLVCRLSERGIGVRFHVRAEILFSREY